MAGPPSKDLVYRRPAGILPIRVDTLHTACRGPGTETFMQRASGDAARCINVAGGLSGVGRAVAEQLGLREDRIACHDANAAEQTARHCRAAIRDIRPDLAAPESVHAVLMACDESLAGVPRNGSSALQQPNSRVRSLGRRRRTWTRCPRSMFVVCSSPTRTRRATCARQAAEALS